MLFLTRKIGIQSHPVAINPSQIIAFHPAVYFGHNGKPDFRDGTHIWTTLEAGGGAENASAWHVNESFEAIQAMLSKSEPLP